MRSNAGGSRPVTRSSCADDRPHRHVATARDAARWCSSPLRSATWATCRPARSRCSATPTSSPPKTPAGHARCSRTRECRRRAALRAVHAHNERAGAQIVVDAVSAGKRVAYVTDAGMPGVSDPGERLVRACLDAGLDVEVVPGPSAVLTALVLSGLPTDRFVFEGFLPRRGPARRERIARSSASGAPRCCSRRRTACSRRCPTCSRRADRSARSPSPASSRSCTRKCGAASCRRQSATSAPRSRVAST